MRVVKVHQAKTQLSGLLDAAHGGETIVLAKAGVLRHQMPLPALELLLEPLGAEELEALEGGLFPPRQQC